MLGNIYLFLASIVAIFIFAPLLIVNIMLDKIDLDIGQFYLLIKSFELFDYLITRSDNYV